MSLYHFSMISCDFSALMLMYCYIKPMCKIQKRFYNLVSELSKANNLEKGEWRDKCNEEETVVSFLSLQVPQTTALFADSSTADNGINRHICIPALLETLRDTTSITKTNYQLF